MQTTWADTPTKRPTFEEIVDTLEQSKILSKHICIPLLFYL